jgi:hypothetical protein
LYNYFGINQNGIKYLEIIINKIIINFEKWEGENIILFQNCFLLLSISKSKIIPNYIFTLKCWINFIDSFINNNILKLNSKFENYLIESLITISENISDLDQKNKYIKQILNTIAFNFSNLVQQNNFLKISQKPEIIQQICTFIEKFRGISRALISDTDSIFIFCSNFFSIFIGLINIYKNYSQIIILILKYCKDFAFYQFENLDEIQSKLFFDFIISIFRNYFDSNIGINFMKSKNEEEDYNKDIYYLLKLLCIISGFSSQNENAKKATLEGIIIILPLINIQLLQVCFF